LFYKTIFLIQRKMIQASYSAKCARDFQASQMPAPVFRFFAAVSHSNPGWPDWENFRL
jgi:hypothetical protein